MVTNNTLQLMQSTQTPSNENKKIAIIGKGTAGILQTLCLLDKGFVNIDIFYDPDIKELPVGESTTPIVASILLNSLNLKISDLVENGIASYKNAVQFINWGSGQTFNHFFAGNTVAFHLFTHKFNSFICKKIEKLGINFIPEKVNDIHETDDFVCINKRNYDHVVHCVGWKENVTSYVNSEFESVNSALVFTKYGNTSFFETIHRAHDSGWQFELPFPEQKLSRCGFLFNNNYLSTDQAFDLFDNNEPPTLLQWQPRYSSRILISNRQSCNGNCLFFLEPLQAFSTFYYINFGTMIANYLENNQPKSIINQEYLKKIQSYQSLIALHYSYGSTFNSDFWRDIINESNKFLQINKIDKELMAELAVDSIGSFGFGLDGFAAEDFLQIHQGMLGLK